MRKIQVVITVLALGVAVLHEAFPEVEVDAITLALLVLAALPWLAPLLKSVELPGGIKIKLRELNRIAEEADEAGLLAPRAWAEERRPAEGISSAELAQAPEYSFLLVADEDPALALAGLRIEIERRLVELAQRRGISARHKGVTGLLRDLQKEQAISPNASAILADMTGYLNRAAHGAEVDPRAASWVIDVGPRLLQALDSELEG